MALIGIGIGTLIVLSLKWTTLVHGSTTCGTVCYVISYYYFIL